MWSISLGVRSQVEEVEAAANIALPSICSRLFHASFESFEGCRLRDLQHSDLRSSQGDVEGSGAGGRLNLELVPFRRSASAAGQGARPQKVSAHKEDHLDDKSNGVYGCSPGGIVWRGAKELSGHAPWHDWKLDSDPRDLRESRCTVPAIPETASGRYDPVAATMRRSSQPPAAMTRRGVVPRTVAKWSHGTMKLSC